MREPIAAPNTTKYSEVDSTGEAMLCSDGAEGARHLEAVDRADRMALSSSCARLAASAVGCTRLTKMSSSELSLECRSLKSMPCSPSRRSSARDAGVARPACRRCRPARGRRRRAPAATPASASGMRSQRRLQLQGQLLLAELAHQHVLVLDHDQLALADHADAVGHLLGLLDVVRGQDDGDAAARAARAPSATCRGAARRRRRRWARRGTGSAARATAPWRSARAASCRRTAS